MVAGDEARENSVQEFQQWVVVAPEPLFGRVRHEEPLPAKQLLCLVDQLYHFFYQLLKPAKVRAVFESFDGGKDALEEGRGEIVRTGMKGSQVWFPTPGTGLGFHTGVLGFSKISSWGPKSNLRIPCTGHFVPVLCRTLPSHATLQTAN